MYKIFFVEDEVVVRNGVKNNIKWENTKYIFAGDSTDGEAALPLIREAVPDILITDIKMPFMDGLELSRIIKGEMPWIKIIILSGHDEFSFAKEAISIGVSEYLLKPFLPTELLEVLDRVSMEIEKDRRRNLIDDKFPFDLESFFKEFAMEVMLASEALLIEYLKFGDRSKLEEFVLRYMDCIKNANLNSSMYYHHALINFVSTILKFMDEIGGSLNNIVPRMNELEQLFITVDSMEVLKNIIENMIIAVIEFRDNKRKSKYGGMIEGVKEYIRQNFSDPEISLNSAAAKVNVSPNHLSSVFSKETGQTFIDYLMKIRIKKAKELLKSTSMRSSEIAFSIGYTDPHYFSHMFKKLEKCTPNEYRNGN